MHPDLISTFVEAYRLAFNATAAEAVAAHKQAQRDLTQVEKKISGIMAAIEDGLYQPNMKDRLATLNSEKASLSSLLEPPRSPLPCGCTRASQISTGAKSVNSRSH